jgi:hypothetical protein
MEGQPLLATLTAGKTSGSASSNKTNSVEEFLGRLLFGVYFPTELVNILL